MMAVGAEKSNLKCIQWPLPTPFTSVFFKQICQFHLPLSQFSENIVSSDFFRRHLLAAITDLDQAFLMEVVQNLYPGSTIFSTLIKDPKNLRHAMKYSSFSSRRRKNNQTGKKPKQTSYAILNAVHCCCCNGTRWKRKPPCAPYLS